MTTVTLVCIWESAKAGPMRRNRVHQIEAHPSTTVAFIQGSTKAIEAADDSVLCLMDAADSVHDGTESKPTSGGDQAGKSQQREQQQEKQQQHVSTKSSSQVSFSGNNGNGGRDGDEDNNGEKNRKRRPLDKDEAAAAGNSVKKKRLEEDDPEQLASGDAEDVTKAKTSAPRVPDAGESFLPAVRGPPMSPQHSRTGRQPSEGADSRAFYNDPGNSRVLDQVNINRDAGSEAVTHSLQSLRCPATDNAPIPRTNLLTIGAHGTQECVCEQVDEVQLIGKVGGSI